MRSHDEPGFRRELRSIPSEPIAAETGRPTAFEESVEPLRIRQVEVAQRHRDLDDAIASLAQAGACDELMLARLKKRKLQIKDEIARIARLLPN